MDHNDIWSTKTQLSKEQAAFQHSIFRSKPVNALSAGILTLRSGWWINYLYIKVYHHCHGQKKSCSSKIFGQQTTKQKPCFGPRFIRTRSIWRSSILASPSARNRKGWPPKGVWKLVTVKNYRTTLWGNPNDQTVLPCNYQTIGNPKSEMEIGETSYYCIFL